jgi:hypothetical protein
MADAASDIENGLRLQAGQCRALGAPFTAKIIEAAADDYADKGVVASLLKDWKSDPVAAALGLRLAGAFHYLASAHPESALGEAYKKHGEEWTSQSLRTLIDETARSDEATMQYYIAHAVQTNEVRRAAALLGGFLEVVACTDLPLDLYEIGASAGLLLNWDRYRYDFGSFGWGGGGLALAAEWKGPRPEWPEYAPVHAREGCDVNPIAYGDDEAVARAAAYIWVEQIDRRERFLKAIAIARNLRPAVARADAGDWLHEKLRGRPEGRATVVYQSVMAQYMSVDARKMVKHAIGNAAQMASASRPVAWLKFEPDDGGVNFAVDLTVWPGGKLRRLAYAHPHGAWVEWLAA